jgi:DNA-binding GntR family transcriptional regulator
MPLPGPEAASSFANAQDLAYGAIRDWIFNGPLKPGEIIRDTDIANLLGISRTPVREAIIRLAQEGLIDVGKGRKTRVSIPDISRAPDLYRIGGTLDGLAAEWAMPKITQDDLRRRYARTGLMPGRGLSRGFATRTCTPPGNLGIFQH